MSDLISHDLLTKFINYCDQTGIVTWKFRDRCYFYNDRAYNCWNSNFSEKEIKCLNTSGYITTSILYKRYQLHRLIWFYMTKEWPNQIDHINGIRNDNRWCNLRNVTAEQNSKNNKKRNDNTSGITGVSFSRRHNLWCAYISNLGKRKHLGWFKEKEEAIKSRKNAEEIFNYHKNHGMR